MKELKLPSDASLQNFLQWYEENHTILIGGGEVSIDCREVDRIGTSVLEFLVSMRKSGVVKIVNISPELEERLGFVGLKKELEL